MRARLITSPVRDAQNRCHPTNADGLRPFALDGPLPVLGVGPGGRLGVCVIILFICLVVSFVGADQAGDRPNTIQHTRLVDRRGRSRRCGRVRSRG
jgi:hypothetical protein